MSWWKNSKASQYIEGNNDKAKVADSLPKVSIENTVGGVSDASTNEITISILKDLEDLKIAYVKREKKAIEIEQSFSILEERMHKSANLTNGLATGICVAFFVAIVFLVMDYFYFKNNFYQKNDLEVQIQKVSKHEDVLNCFASKGYFSTKCFTN